MMITIAGACCSGKSFLADSIAKLSKASVLHLDDYSIPRSVRLTSRSYLDVENHDIPAGYDHDSALEAIAKWRAGITAEVPIYEFAKSEIKGMRSLKPTRILVVEGLFTLHDARFRNAALLKIYVSTSLDLMLGRRIVGSIHFQSIEDSILKHIRTVVPGHQQFVEPSRQYADMIVDLGYEPSAPHLVNETITEKTARIIVKMIADENQDDATE